MQKKKLTPLQIVGHILHTGILAVLAVVMAVFYIVSRIICFICDRHIAKEEEKAEAERLEKEKEEVEARIAESEKKNSEDSKVVGVVF